MLGYGVVGQRVELGWAEGGLWADRGGGVYAELGHGGG